jgi:diguanylate cyclase
VSEPQDVQVPTREHRTPTPGTAPGSSPANNPGDEQIELVVTHVFSPESSRRKVSANATGYSGGGVAGWHVTPVVSDVLTTLAERGPATQVGGQLGTGDKGGWHKHLQDALDALSDAIVLFNADGSLALINNAAVELFGNGTDPSGWQADTGDCSLWDLDGNRLYGPTLPGATVLRTRRASHQVLWKPLQDGKVQWFAVTAGPVGTDPDSRVMVVLRDITEERELTAALAESEERYRNTLTHLPDPVLELRPVHEDDELVGLDVCFVNPAASNLDHEALTEILVPTARRVWQGGGGETRVVKLDEVDWQIKISKAGDRMVAVGRDVTESSRAVEAARHSVDTDPGTGLASRSKLEQRINEILDRPEGGSAALLLVRLPWLDQHRSGYGFGTADIVVTAAAQRLVEWASGPGWTVARVSDTTLSVLVEPVLSVSDARNKAEELAAELGHDIVVDGSLVGISAAIGVALAPLHGESAAAVLRRASAASTAAIAGSLAAVVWKPGTPTPEQNRLDLLGRLGEAAETREIFLEYHPRYHLADGRFWGLEARAIWEHPKRGRLPEPAFLPSLIDSPQLELYARWLITTALREAGPVLGSTGRVAVNLPAALGARKSFSQLITDALLDVGAQGGMLALELAERGTGTSVEPVSDYLHEMQDLGVAVHLDDFGTTTSSLLAISRLPVNGINLDRSLGRDIHRNHVNQRIVAGCVDVAHAVGVLVTATGIETRAAHETFTALNCDIAQGYWYSRPVSATALTNGWVPTSSDLVQPHPRDTADRTLDIR